MSLESIRQIVEANAGLSDASLQRVRCADVIGAIDELPLEKLDWKAKDIRIGPANIIREQATEERKASVTAFFPLQSLRHILKLAGG